MRWKHVKHVVDLLLGIGLLLLMSYQVTGEAGHEWTGIGMTALCGINMSVHAVPFLADFMRASLGRRLHLSLSYWCFVLMGLHLGMHMPAMLKNVKGKWTRRIGFACSILAAGAGLWLFLKNGYPDYLFFRVPFAFIDYEKAASLVLLEALLISSFWVFIGAQLAKLLSCLMKTKQRKMAEPGR